MTQDLATADDAAPASDEPIARAGPIDSEPPVFVLLALFTAIAIGLTFPNLAHFRTMVGGDSGDSLLNLWIMRSVQLGLPHGWHALWNRPIFAPAANTLAYSDTLFPVALVHWPLRLIFGDVVAFNLISLGSWVLCSWCTYRLARRFTQYWGAAFIAALAFTYASIRLAHQQHFQLVVGGALVPLVVLSLLRVLESPSPRRGIAVGVAFAATTLTASYYGAMLAVVVLVIAGGWVLLEPRTDRRPMLIALAYSLVVIAILVLPFGYKYVELQRDAAFRRGFEPSTAAHLDDFLSAGTHNYVLDHVPKIGERSKPTSRGVENRLFPGFVALGFGALGAGLLLAREVRPRRWRTGRLREIVLIVGAGAACLVMSVGDWIHLGHQRVYMPFIVFRHFVPGFAGIRAPARFVLVAQLALCVVAAVGLDALLRRVARAPVRMLCAFALAGVVCAETAMGLIFVRVPTSNDDGGVDVALRAHPRGIVLELPIESVRSGATWPYAESPRQLLALRDHDPRINGYSGFQPKNFDYETAILDEFPSARAVALARSLHVRYVVLRTALVGPLTPQALLHEKPLMGTDGQGVYSEATVQRMLMQLSPAVAPDVVRLPGAYLVDIGK